jgi:hypothetical protein
MITSRPAIDPGQDSMGVSLPCAAWYLADVQKGGMSSVSRSLVQVLFFAAQTDFTTWHSRTCEVECRSVNELLSMPPDSAITEL